MSSSSVSARAKARAGPPRRTVVKSASLTGSLGRRTVACARVSTFVSPDRAVTSTVTWLPSSLPVTTPDTSTSGALVVVGDHDRGGEPDAVLGHRGRVPGPLGEEPAGQRHREHAVRDHVGQADRLGDALVPVDDVEVARGAGVPDQVRPGHLVLPGRDLGARLRCRGSRGLAIVSPYAPRSTRVECAVQTCSPSTVLISVTVAIVVMLRTCLIDSIVVCATTTSPARSGRA